jgi:hypothetical protein
MLLEQGHQFNRTFEHSRDRCAAGDRMQVVKRLSNARDAAMLLPHAVCRVGNPHHVFVLRAVLSLS